MNKTLKEFAVIDAKSNAHHENLLHRGYSHTGEYHGTDSYSHPKHGEIHVHPTGEWIHDDGKQVHSGFSGKHLDRHLDKNMNEGVDKFGNELPVTSETHPAYKAGKRMGIKIAKTNWVVSPSKFIHNAAVKHAQSSKHYSKGRTLSDTINIHHNFKAGANAGIKSVNESDTLLKSVIMEAKSFKNGKYNSSHKFDVGNEVRAIARERIGQPKKNQIITSKKDKPVKHKEKFV